VTHEFDIDATGLELLRLACEALDRADEARVEIDEHGLFSENRYGRRVASQAFAVERDSRVSAARLFRELGLDAVPDTRSALELRRRGRSR
jgi:hypothetical protein